MMRSPSSLPDDIRQKTGERIGDVVLDLLGLSVVAKKAHWNVRGPLFGQLHALFDELYKATSDHADTLAEHVAMLGLSVRGDHVEIASNASAEPIGEEHDGIELCGLLFDRIRTVLADIDANRILASNDGNEDGAQLLLDASIALSGLGWQIGAYMDEDEPSTERVGKSVLPIAPTNVD